MAGVSAAIQKWLAYELEVTEGAVSRYASGKTTPRKSLQERLFEALELPYKTIDDFLQDKIFYKISKAKSLTDTFTLC